MTCTGDGIAEAGQYANLGTVTGTDELDAELTDTDPSHYFGVASAIEIEKATNGEDADGPPGPFIAVGDPVDWTYVVTNTGNITLVDVVVTDDQGVAVTCPDDDARSWRADDLHRPPASRPRASTRTPGR